VIFNFHLVPVLQDKIFIQITFIYHKLNTKIKYFYLNKYSSSIGKQCMLVATATEREREREMQHSVPAYGFYPPEL
jgi:hypothetical protein